jgi:hypothetical protein
MTHIARAFAPLAPGETDNFAFDFTDRVGSETIVSASWVCSLLSYQTVVDPEPQSHVLAVSAQTVIGLLGEGALYLPGGATLPVLPETGAFACALIGGFTPAPAVVLYNLEATVKTSGGRTLSLDADLPIEVSQ